MEIISILFLETAYYPFIRSSVMALKSQYIMMFFLIIENVSWNRKSKTYQNLIATGAQSELSLFWLEQVNTGLLLLFLLLLLFGFFLTNVFFFSVTIYTSKLIKCV